MRAMVLTVSGLLGLVACASAGPIEATKIVGVWEVAKGEAPKGAKLEFTKDGKCIMTQKVKEEDVRQEVAYKIEGDRILMTRERDGKKQTRTGMILKLTDTVLILREKEVEVEFRRVK